jgi:hypothetical protein
VKIGAEEKNKVRIMIGCLVLALLSVIYWVRSMSPDSAAASVPQPKTAAQPAARKSGVPVREITLDPTLRMDILLASQKVQYDGGKRNIFRMEELPPPPLPKPSNVPPVRPVDPPPPPKPPINLKFFGFSTKPGEPKKVFLSEGEEIFVAKEGDIINRRYKILQITNTSVMVEDMLNDNKQSIPLTAPPPG